MRHNSTGQLGFNSLDSKVPWLREGTTKNGAKYQTLNLSVASSKNNRINCEMFGMVRDSVKTMSPDNEKIEIPWDERKNVLDKIASYKKFVLDLGNGNRFECATEWDFIELVKEHLDELKTGNFMVTGQVNKDFYNGTVRDRAQIQNIYKVDDEAKCVLKITMDYYWTADSIDTADWKEEKKLRINGWTPIYISSEKKNMYVAQQVILCADKIDFGNEKHVKLLNYKLKQLGLELDGEKIKSNLKAKKVYKIPVTCNYINGAQEVEFDESMLTANQRESIELGLKKLSDFAGRSYGERITEYRIVDFDLRGDYEDGCIPTDDKLSDFNEEIYTPEAEEKVDDVFDGMNKPETETDESLDDLFG